MLLAQLVKRQRLLFDCGAEFNEVEHLLSPLQ